MYISGSKLVGDRTGVWLLKAQVTESQFAHDLALYAVSRTAFESASKSFVEVASYFGLTVSLPKTKGLALGLESVRYMFPQL